MASWFKRALTISLLCIFIAVAVVSAFLLGYWFRSTGSGHWMLVSSSSRGGAQTLGIFQTRRRCFGFLEIHKQEFKKLRGEQEIRPEDKEFLASLEREDIMGFRSDNRDLRWLTVSCIRLSNGFALDLLSDMESTIDDLKRRIGDIESR